MLLRLFLLLFMQKIEFYKLEKNIYIQKIPLISLKMFDNNFLTCI